MLRNVLKVIFVIYIVCKIEGVEEDDVLRRPQIGWDKDRKMIMIIIVCKKPKLHSSKYRERGIIKYRKH